MGIKASVLAEGRDLRPQCQDKGCERLTFLFEKGQTPTHHPHPSPTLLVKWVTW